ncbi:hypothetical protein [Marinilabilia salmonicolor]|jgi:hypothetical protein|uniref:Uncharacterized protein n=1 Tax=Marinilabilia salmonicolor TaxID=989 RepID=A0A2T0WS46_9BACT|nr:hypothetical protein [Marinilabilia salmonicolor]PRY89516.1 hypothetical protein BY457_12913 [Marinilabilia salmonicolor]RCW27488.1 hypothetical protein DFO77_13720 [Marinilabilia salmonicolor]
MEKTELILIFAPITVIAVFTLILVKWFLDHEAKKRRQEFLMANSNQLLTQRLQAFERFTLFLERISPESLVLREQQKNMNAFQLQSHLLKTIRTEFGHNLAMQIYLPSDTWEQIKKAREEVSRVINTASTQVPPNVPSFELGRRIIEDAGATANQAVTKALDKIRKDVDELGIR